MKKYLIAGGATLFLGFGAISNISTQTSTDIAYVSGETITLKTQVDGLVIDDHNWKVGDIVKKGEVLLSIDNHLYLEKELQLSALVEKEKQAWLETQSEIEEIDEKITLLKERLSISNGVFLSSNSFVEAQKNTKEFNSLKTLIESEYNHFDVYKTQNDTEINILTLKKKRELLTLILPSKKALYNIAQEKLTLHQKENSRYQVKAPSDSIIESKSISMGENITYSEELYKLSGSSVLWLTAYFKETERQNLKIGQPVEIEFDAIPGTTKGKIYSISSLAGAELGDYSPNYTSGYVTRYVQRFPVTIHFDSKDIKDKVAIGFSAKVSLSE
ncbi:MAG: hypothetical protein CL943_02055 [Candidatus Diapherotrites archaeon]|uniref:Uncharacterized protein n=1 Tax=Candidatus Iainarchaeum sp. TaxID=3101447 RepID=A0A2D6M0W0_9ARCH|nr:hypothetical protein [Candidatus Diapherotrites archaeon]